LVIAFVSKVVGVHNLSLRTTRGDHQAMDNPLAYACDFDKRYGKRGIHSGRVSYTSRWDTTKTRAIKL
jgi:hypothetical protein